jgi:hypothetical protein
MMKSKLLFLTCLTVLAFSANASDGYSVKELMMKALNSPSGSASGVVIGDAADKIHSTTGSYDPLRGEVRTLKRYKEEGCSRLEVKLIQPNTPTKEGTKTDFTLNYDLNLCKSGMPPRDTSQ